MTQLSEEKLKEILGEHSQNLQASISKIDKSVVEIKNKVEGIDKTVGEIKIRFGEQQNSASTMWLFSIGVALFAISISLLSWGTNKNNEPLVIGGTASIMLSALLLLLGFYINHKSLRPNRQDDNSSTLES